MFFRRRFSSVFVKFSRFLRFSALFVGASLRLALFAKLFGLFKVLRSFWAGLRPLLSKTKQNDERKDRYVQASTQSHPKEARRESIMQHI